MVSEISFRTDMTLVNCCSPVTAIKFRNEISLTITFFKEKTLDFEEGDVSQPRLDIEAAILNSE